jgi:hypothetical protein
MPIGERKRKPSVVRALTDKDFAVAIRIHRFIRSFGTAPQLSSRVSEIATCDIFARAPILLSRLPCHAVRKRTIWLEHVGNTGLAGKIMDELIGRLVSDVGVDRGAAETAIGIILDFLAKEGPADKVQLLIAKLPGAEALQQKAAGAGGSGMGGVMGAGMSMMAAGLSMGRVQDVTRQFIAFAREKVGEDAVGEIVAAIPGLSQFV